ncbi:hypothetical protein BGW36DRAFT_434019 [Talaromyces proteolyticus]|uniref:Uncharacterized protein n=1 Tax=Talaromyces proteolyticus TaxID=1131652 RepID=A0AAD4KG61_9EURO|nr:uncharacterized protein BGW36DRAFT_434019 [Talaromyces proteolyticus]KAH8688721.1 hypothetical protein BGW36DRAFT_434019 [Talaromyces proteolyticus]
MSLTCYATFHESPKGPGDARRTARRIIEDEGLGNEKLKNKSIFITGASSGIGVEIAKAIFLIGATLFLKARHIEKAKQALGEELTESCRVHLLEIHLDSFESVRTYGFETQFGTNQLGHFLLFALLHAASRGANARAIFVSSLGHRFGNVNFHDYNVESDDNAYDAWKAYGQSKTANLWTANEADRRYRSHRLCAFSVHPGGVIETGLMQFTSNEWKQQAITNPVLGPRLKTTEQGAATVVWAALSKSLNGIGGKYLEEVQIANPWNSEDGDWGPGYGSHAYCPDKERELWELSLKLVGFKG